MAKRKKPDTEPRGRAFVKGGEGRWITVHDSGGESHHVFIKDPRVPGKSRGKAQPSGPSLREQVMAHRKKKAIELRFRDDTAKKIRADRIEAVKMVSGIKSMSPDSRKTAIKNIHSAQSQLQKTMSRTMYPADTGIGKDILGKARLRTIKRVLKSV